MMTCGIYYIVNRYDGTHYVGMSIDIEKRIEQHKRLIDSAELTRHHYGATSAMWMARRKSFDDTFTWHIAETVPNARYLRAREVAHQDSLLSRAINLYNQAGCGAGAGRDSQSLRDKKSLRTKEGMARMSEEQKAQRNARASAALKGRPVSSEHAAKIGAALRGRCQSEAHKAALSAVRRGKEINGTGVICVTTGEIFRSTAATIRKHGGTISGLRFALADKRPYKGKLYSIIGVE